MTTVANRKFITCSNTLIHNGTGERETYSLSTRLFLGSHKKRDIVRYIDEVSFIPITSFTIVLLS